MLKDKKFKKLWALEWILPWLILIPGIVAGKFFTLYSTTYYNNGNPTAGYAGAKILFTIFYFLAMGGGLGVILTETVIGLKGLIWLIKNICKKNKEPYSILRPFVLWICPFLFNFGTLILMLFVQAITYGQGV